VVYSGLSCRDRAGEAFTILGGSGVGKSVMLKMLIGLLKPDRGRSSSTARAVAAWTTEGPRALRQRVGMVFQGAALFDSLTVRENVAYGLREHLRMSEAEIAERVAWALALVGLPGIELMSPSDLSGGMRKRVGLARTIALKPEVLLYDEPTTGLDPINTTRINNLVDLAPAHAQQHVDRGHPRHGHGVHRVVAPRHGLQGPIIATGDGP
jgi:phospholipid/cholesterol/gamma-HCH transport system ATP-binding protein